MILVTFAVPFESAAFRKRAVSRSVRIVHTGVGMDAARVALENAVCESMPERVIASGFAGALVPDIHIGDIVCDMESKAGRQSRFATAHEVLANAISKREFREQTGAEVVDMETDAIREVCRVANIQVTALRAISDEAEDDLGLPPELLHLLARHPLRAMPKLVHMLLADKSNRQGFMRLIRGCRQAQMMLADALEQEIASRSFRSVGTGE